ncbi:TrmH family RNA methyltransferase [Flavobacterium sp. H122]|uniref:TrmH family RNA methyltransferase n=1 Tax=Flavobacterium sp. H122 TaxID=2529860 RepID=UPI0010A9A884|nr:TrmH family RNA methyltransferase [Flavobacterium sp. H122]
MEQLTHYTTSFESKQFPITVICDEVYFQDNIGSIFRICDAFGVEKIIFTGNDFVFSERKINKTSRSTHKRLPYEIIKDKSDVLKFLKKSNSEILILEITSTSKPITSLNFDISKPVILIIGNEINGVSNELLSTYNNCYHINMFGKNSSMNVVQSLAIALHEVTKLL